MAGQFGRTVLFFSLGIFGILGSCVKPTVERSKDNVLRERQTTEMENMVKTKAQNGDWIASRGYKLSDHLVVGVTNMPLSHVGIFDADRDEVIEAEGKGIHATRLVDFVEKSNRILLIRPIWSKKTQGDEALENARSLIGKGYDFLGTIGFNHPKRFYCSELAVHIYKKFQKPGERLPGIIEPGQLYLWGNIIYDSRPRAGE